MPQHTISKKEKVNFQINPSFHQPDHDFRPLTFLKVAILVLPKSRSQNLTGLQRAKIKGKRSTHIRLFSLPLFFLFYPSFFFLSQNGNNRPHFLSFLQKSPTTLLVGVRTCTRFHRIFCELQGFCRRLGHKDSVSRAPLKSACMQEAQCCPVSAGSPPCWAVQGSPITAGLLTTRELCWAKAQRQLKPQDHGQESLGGLRLLLLQLLL